MNQMINVVIEVITLGGFVIIVAFELKSVLDVREEKWHWFAVAGVVCYPRW